MHHVGETAAAPDYGGGREFAVAGRLTDRHAKKWEHWRARVQCAGCAQPISPTVPMAVRGARAYHSSCAGRHDDRVRTGNAPASEQVIGHIRGIACPLGQWGTIHRGDYDLFERFERGCFDDSIRRGGQTLQRDHDGVAIPGLLRFTYAPEGLAFTFAVHDTERGRSVLDSVRAGRCKGCSVAYTRAEIRKDAFTRGDIVVAAELAEVSLIFRNRSAWFATFAEAID